LGGATNQLGRRYWRESKEALLYFSPLRRFFSSNDSAERIAADATNAANKCGRIAMQHFSGCQTKVIRDARANVFARLTPLIEADFKFEQIGRNISIHRNLQKMN